MALWQAFPFLYGYAMVAPILIHGSELTK